MGVICLRRHASLHMYKCHVDHHTIIMMVSKTSLVLQLNLFSFGYSLFILDNRYRSSLCIASALG
jgi:hypothetical protein